MRKLTKSQVIALAKKVDKLEVELYPSNCSPLNQMWVQGYKVDLRINEGTPFHFNQQGTPILFDSVINSFSAFNCNYELGNRVHFYVKD